MPAKERSLEELKAQLQEIRSQIDDLEEPKKEKAVRTLHRWQAFSRPYYRRGSKFLIYSALLLLIICLVLLFLREFFVMAPLMALAFVAYVMTTVPPDIVENQITTQGINSDNQSYLWREMEDFWFAEKRGFLLLEIDTLLRWPRRLVLVVNVADREKVKEMIAKYLPYRELPKRTWIDIAGEKLSHAFHQITS